MVRAGAVYASSRLEALAFPIAGHHGGLPDKCRLKAWLNEKSKSDLVRTALDIALAQLPELEPASPLRFPDWGASKLEAECYIRLLFSALVDADFLDTEAHFSSLKSEHRGKAPGPAPLWERFLANQRRLTGHKSDPVNQLRHRVYQAAVTAAVEKPGFFRLTVPTGGGKTRSALAFALRHSSLHGLDRVIVSIPYTSIIDQTASDYRKILGADAVLEHHSAIQVKEDPENPPPAEQWERLASENWDAPVVATTTVQLFESLFSNRTSACRKLHNLARSAVILDEVQMLPVRLLDPVLAMLRELVAHYGVSVVLCTATQPALENSPYLEGLEDVREIAPDPPRLFAELRRVTYEWLKAGEPCGWSEVAGCTGAAAQALAVVNTKRDAMALLDALGRADALHLSTQMCGAHRLATIQEVKRRLKEGEPCCLVSTQVVEAGVDLDFPMVLRAVGPLDRIVQAAGRCNREGTLPAESARVIIFNPGEATRLPSGEYRAATATTLAMLQESQLDFHNPGMYAEYFRRIYQVADLDSANIQEKRKSLDYPAVAASFRMIEDDSVPAVVPYRGANAKDCAVDGLLEDVRRNPKALSRERMRRLQPYLINLRRYLVARYEREGLLAELSPGLYEWTGAYDPVRGVTAAPRDPAELVV